MTPHERLEIVKKELGVRHTFIMQSFFSQSRIADEILTTGKTEDCGTACCIAGEAACIFPQEFAEVAARKLAAKEFQIGYYGEIQNQDYRSIVPIAQVAAEVLGVPTALFFAYEWPPEISGLKYLQDEFDELFTSEERLERALEAIEFFKANPNYVADPLPDGDDDDDWEEEEEEDDDDE